MTGLHSKTLLEEMKRGKEGGSEREREEGTERGRKISSNSKKKCVLLVTFHVVYVKNGPPERF